MRNKGKNEDAVEFVINMLLEAMNVALLLLGTILATVAYITNRWSLLIFASETFTLGYIYMWKGIKLYVKPEIEENSRKNYNYYNERS